MTTRTSSNPRWRVTAKGSTSAGTIDPKALWEKGEMVNAHLWAEALAPDSEFTVERYGTQGAKDAAVASVRMTVRLNAADASAAERTVRVLLDEAMPTVAFTEVVAEAITGRYVAGGQSEPMCSFCGRTQRQVKTLIAGPGVYICDECVETMADTIHEDD